MMPVAAIGAVQHNIWTKTEFENRIAELIDVEQAERLLASGTAAIIPTKMPLANSFSLEMNKDMVASPPAALLASGQNLALYGPQHGGHRELSLRRRINLASIVASQLLSGPEAFVPVSSPVNI